MLRVCLSLVASWSVEAWLQSHCVNVEGGCLKMLRNLWIWHCPNIEIIQPNLIILLNKLDEMWVDLLARSFTRSSVF